MKFYEVVKSNDEYYTMLPPLHYSESDVVWFYGNKKEVKNRIRTWKKLKVDFTKEFEK